MGLCCGCALCAPWALASSSSGSCVADPENPEGIVPAVVLRLWEFVALFMRTQRYKGDVDKVLSTSLPLTRSFIAFTW